MTNSDPAGIIGKRYILHEQLGAGGMGEVYRATDRLNGQAVALKRVLAPAQQLMFATRAASSTDARLALAAEFRTLAALRHPNIVGVLDYGFDADLQPYFTMELLHDPQPLVSAGEGQALVGRVGLLIQVFQALAYLHRRGILHRDLKPGNVLVTADSHQVRNQVKVVDFGLSVQQDQSAQAAGTLLYMAPELLTGQQASVASDLYAVGVMAYELLTGHHPFEADSSSKLIDNVLRAAPDLSLVIKNVPGEPAIVRIIDLLLRKMPAERYADAEAVIRDLSAAIGQPLPSETRALRESFLQTARLVGREAELAQLSNALGQAISGQGSAWLIGGESGVGKSRLVDELRTRGLVKGMLALRGQGVAGGGLPYQLWREPLRRLALLTEPGDLAAGVLMTLLPDIGTLLGRPIPDPPPLEARLQQQRLISTIVRLFEVADTPILLILEDLQWVDESLEPLRQLARLVNNLPLMIVGTYRDDERPNLPSELPGMQLVKLARLSGKDISALSYSMLGEVGRAPAIVDLLQKETEGNAFFVVEVVRALAEEAGGLGNIGHKTLPARIFAGGVQQAIARRLSRVHVTDRPLLTLAAVAGRALDMAILRALAPNVSLDDWLTRGVNAAVFTVQDGRWQFAHDKLREGLLDTPEAQADAAQLHRRVAEAIEAAHADNLAPYYADLAGHYNRAGDRERELFYAQRAGADAAARFANAEALVFLSRALELTPDSDPTRRFDLLMTREKVHDVRGNREAQAADLAAMGALLKQLDNPARRADLLLRQANYAQHVGKFAEASELARQAIALAAQHGLTEHETEGHSRLGQALIWQGDMVGAQREYEQALRLARAARLHQWEIASLNNLGSVTFELGDREGASRYYTEAYQLAEKSGHKQHLNDALNGLGLVAALANNFEAAQGYLEQALRTSREIGDRMIEARMLHNLGELTSMQHRYAEAQIYLNDAARVAHQVNYVRGQYLSLMSRSVITYLQGAYSDAEAGFERALRLIRETGDKQAEAYALVRLAMCAYWQRDWARAEALSREGTRIAQEIKSKGQETFGLAVLGDILLELGRLDEAAMAHQQALELNRAMGRAMGVVGAKVALARVALAKGEAAEARTLADQVVPHLLAGEFDNADEPFGAFLVCYRVLRTSDDPRAGEVLAKGHALLMKRADLVGPVLRQQFLEAVPENRALQAAWAEHNQ